MEVCRSCHLFEHWPTILRRLRRARRVALFLDFDGTLAPIRPMPREVELDAATRSLLLSLVKHPRFLVTLISGRRRADLQQRVGVRRARYLGLHGWEDNGGVQLSPGAKAALQGARKQLLRRLEGLQGVWMEGKGPIFAVHYRGASPNAVRAASAALREVMKPFAPPLTVMKGKRVWEVLPYEMAGKGMKLALLLAELPEGSLPVYVGDDTTDESAFAALTSGITVRVGASRRSRARFWLRHPSEVQEFLRRLATEMS